MEHMVTIKEIARQCGVSSATVSRALTGHAKVRPDTQRRILECAERLGYEQQRQKGKQDRKVMLIVGDISNQFYVGIVRGVRQQLAAEGIKVAIFDSEYHPEQEEEYIRFAYSDNYDGIIMVTAMETTSLISLLKRNACPVVLVNRFIRSMDLNAVCIDNHRGGYMATSHLIEKGHTKIAHLAGPQNSTASQDRLAGYRNALEDAGLSLHKEAVFTGDLMRESGERFAEYYLKKLRDCTAVFCANDICASGFVEVVTRSGLEIPQDLSVVCFDDSTMAVGGAVALTSVSRDPFSMGEAAAELMSEALEYPNHMPRKLVFPPILHERESVGERLVTAASPHR